MCLGCRLSTIPVLCCTKQFCAAYLLNQISLLVFEGARVSDSVYRTVIYRDRFQGEKVSRCCHETCNTWYRLLNCALLRAPTYLGTLAIQICLVFSEATRSRILQRVYVRLEFLYLYLRIVFEHSP
jgi:hypothetical protein